MPLTLSTVDGLPAHPLLVDAVAVLLPLAAVCSVVLAVHGGLRRRFDWPVLVLAAVAVIAVPMAQQTGRELDAALTARGVSSALIARHAALGSQLLPYALGFGVAVVVLFVAGRLADRERAAAGRRSGGGPAEPPGTVSRTWRRIAVLAAVLVIGTAAVTTVQVVRIGTSGAQAVWQQYRP
jgi:hypothetical protein